MGAFEAVAPATVGPATAATPSAAVQVASLGRSDGEVHAAALAAAEPQEGLRWLDIGCGHGAMLSIIDARYRPAALTGLDLIDWLAPALRRDVKLVLGPAEDTLTMAEPADRVLMVEVLEHLEAPWTVLRRAARLVAPRGRLVLTTPNITSLRHRLELPLRGQLTSFRPDNDPHLQPVLAHVVERILADEGLSVRRFYAGADVIPATGGRNWPARLRARWPALASTSAVFVATRSA